MAVVAQQPEVLSDENCRPRRTFAVHLGPIALPGRLVGCDGWQVDGESTDQPADPPVD